MTIPQVSFEFFPPKTDAMEAALWETIKRLEPLSPRFVSVTYGAGGSTRERTHATVERIVRETTLKPAAHLTCVAASRDEVDAVARSYWASGVRHIVALRGDLPQLEAGESVPANGYPYAVDLVAGLKKIADFDISVAAYPETHPTAPSADFEIDYLKRKIDAGASRAITQFFFDADSYFCFMDRVRNAGITVPIIPGILPVTNFAQVVKFSKMCGTAIPASLAHLFEGLDGDPETRKMVAATVAIDLCRRLQEQGVDEFHFYTLNRPELTRSICHLLGIRPTTA